MLTGTELGKAIEAARLAKGISKKKLAEDFGVAAPSVQGWVKTGRIDKAKLMQLIDYFSDVVDARHWGLAPRFFDRGSADDAVAETISVEGLPVPLAKKIASYRPILYIERFDASGSMGPGVEPPEVNTVVEHMGLDANWVRQNLVYSATENLKLISGRGDSMAPTIRSGDALLVDIGVNSVESDAIYYFEMGGRLHIKRIQRNLDGLTIISDNTQYREITVPADREDDIRILAQIIYWWTGRSF
ncbi:phage repressor protein [Pseudomonas guariconensis]|uniref:LexA family transcriptional regulator n=1 Tax=Pseudomonas TaxID=286 RepID=UPI002096D018|nr:MULTISPECIES: XRE family transcriptional regulator [Pseudomonas]MCO7513739.1 phage repressor protein [Pseudomonas putida]MCO7603860.1 phage repressor protein [Pseudomonas guariconensis]